MKVKNVKMKTNLEILKSFRGDPIPPRRIQETEKRKLSQSRARRKSAWRKEVW